MLNSVLWNRQITRKNKSIIYNSIIKSIISMEMYFLRRSAKCSRLEKIKNNVIREKISIKNSVLDDIRDKQLNWYGHVQRMDLEEF